MKAEFSYDELPYPSFTFPQTNPNRLATIAALHGLTAAAPDTCRYLELGCGDGTNLMSLAYTMPESEFIGIDLSRVHIVDAKASTDRIGMKNTTFYQMDLMNVSLDEFGKFDYIVAHGLFSWVPADTRAKILEIYSQMLNKNGIGYISYNAFPGCHFRSVVRDLMRYHSSAETDLLTKIEMGKDVLTFVCDSLPRDGIYRKLLEHELTGLAERSASNIRHDDLADINQPYYLNEFVAEIGLYGLQYIADASPYKLGDGNVSANTSKTLDVIAPTRVEREQYLDFIGFTRFRSSIICGPSAKIDRTLGKIPIADLMIASQVTPVGENQRMNGDGVVRFSSPSGNTFELNHPLTKIAMARLRNAWPRALAFPELLAACRESIDDKNTLSDSEIEITKNYFLELFKAGFTNLHVYQPDFSAAVSEFPEASLFARWQIERQAPAVTTLTGMNLATDSEAVAILITLLDGTRNKQQLAEEMSERLSIPFNERGDFVDRLPEMLDENLAKLAQCGLLIR